MTRGGDDGEFQTHPGDPWHPGWSDDAEAREPKVGKPPQAESPKKRRFLGRKRRERDEAVDESSPADEDVAVVVAPIGDDTLFRPAEQPEPEASEPPAVSRRPAAEPPMPAWLSDPPQLERDVALAVELPSWVGKTTAGAEGVAAGFEEPTDSAAAVPGASPGGDDLAAALSALGALDDADVEVAVGESLETDRDTADLPTVGLDAFEALRALEGDEGPPAFAGTYGVAGKEAFEALREGDTDDLSDWDAFAGAGSAPSSPVPTAPTRPAPSELPAERPVVAEAAALDEPAGADGEPRHKRGIWPFRRRRRDEEAVAEEAADWDADGKPVPGTWFPEVDEDVVVPPIADLPEVEWPSPPASPDPDVAFRPPTATLDPDRTVEVPLLSAPRPATPRRTDEPAPPREPEVPRWADIPPGVAPIETPPPVGSPAEDHSDADTDDLQAGGPWRLEFDDGTSESPYGSTAYDPAPAPAVRGDRDEWEETLDGDRDATVEMADPGLRVGEDIYSGSVTVEHRGLAEEMLSLGDKDTEWQAMAAVMPGVESGVVGFEDVADLRTDEEYREQPRSDLGMRVGTGLLLLVFLLGTMFVGGGAMAVFIGAMALLGIWEFYGTLQRLEFRPLTFIGYLGGAGMLAAAWFHGPIAVPIAIALTVILIFFIYAFSPLREDALANGGLTVLGSAWVAGSVAFASPMLRQDDFRVLVMAVVVSTVAMDVGSFSFGRTWGKRALSPVLSPNKSIEGLVGGILLAMGAAVAFGVLAEPFDIASGIALGAVVVVMAPLGDLAESMVKRSLGVKDMGTILPGHGGVLDRIDAFLFVLPASWALYQVMGFLG
ncbi:MAG TPA: phosphatidate cytidylyltransferase [Acidimicrobiia bacterium]|nr:phosphatidate cytidylyltransferase [Acidimicrobiia bacterium]